MCTRKLVWWTWITHAEVTHVYQPKPCPFHVTNFNHFDQSKATFEMSCGILVTAAWWCDSVKWSKLHNKHIHWLEIRNSYSLINTVQHSWPSQRKRRVNSELFSTDLNQSTTESQHPAWSPANYSPSTSRVAIQVSLPVTMASPVTTPVVVALIHQDLGCLELSSLRVPCHQIQRQKIWYVKRRKEGHSRSTCPCQNALAGQQGRLSSG